MSKRERINIKSLNGVQTITITTIETHRRGTPKDLSGALENGLQELWGFLRSNRRPFKPETVETLLKHVKDSLAQNFNVAMLNAEKPEDIQALWTSIFPTEAGGKDKPKGKLRSAA